MKTLRRVLAIETSCDDTSVALVREDGWVEALSSASQDMVHAPFGGIVPEIASRNHTNDLLPTLETVFAKSGLNWSDVDGIAVTNRPGLVGSLLVGLVTAKSLALSKELPFIGVNHLEGHLLAPFLKDEEYQPEFEFDQPLLGWVISGGHSSLYRLKQWGMYELLGRTVDDAAGEAFDKFAKLIGLGYPGGVKVDVEAEQGDPGKYEFPRALIHEDHFNVSFSGLKASAQRMIAKMEKAEIEKETPHLCASYRRAITDVLLKKLDRAVDRFGLDRVVITGGVSANKELRERGQVWAQEKGVRFMVPPLRYCTDNAAMIGMAGAWRLKKGQSSEHDLPPSPRSLEDDFIIGEIL